MTAELHAKIGVLEAALAQAEIAQEEDARKKANIAEEQAKNKEVQAISVQGEIEKLTTELSEMQRVNEFLSNAYLEVCGRLDGTSNINAVFNENKSVQEQFLATFPLELAIATNNLDAAKLLISKGASYDKWSEIVDNNTPLYYLLSNDTKDVNGTVINLSNLDYNSLKLSTPEEAYSSSQVSIRQMLGIADTSYMDLTYNQRTAVNNRLLAFTKHFYEVTNKPAFLLYDFTVLYDANLCLSNDDSHELLLALNNHIDTQINYLSGYSTLYSTHPVQFMAWA